MIEIELNNIKKNYGLKNVLDGVSFEVKTGERISIIGENGSGKSTLFRIINGDDKQDSGIINIKSNSTIGFLKQVYDKEQDDLVVENYLKRSFENYKEIEEKLEELEYLMSKENENLELLLKKYGNLQEKYIAMRWLWTRRKIQKNMLWF